MGEIKMKLLRKIISKIFYKKYKISEVPRLNYVYNCNGRIIRSFKEDDSKKAYCAAYVLAGFKE